MALQAVAAGVDGLMLEIHREPENALSDDFLSLGFEEIKSLLDKVKIIYATCSHISLNIYRVCPDQTI